METRVTQMRSRLLFGRRHFEVANLGGNLAGIEASTGAAPILGGKLDVPVTRSMAKDAENVAQVLA